MNRKNQMITLVVLVSILLTGCTNLENKNIASADWTDASTYGSVYANIYNGACCWVDAEGNPIYYCAPNHEVVVANSTDSNVKIMENAKLFDINVVGDTLYGLVKYTDNGYYGTEIISAQISALSDKITWKDTTVLKEGVMLDLQVVDDILYYINAEDMTFCRLNPSTGEETVLIQEACQEAMVYNQKVYYTLKDKNNEMHAISLETNEDISVKSCTAFRFIPYKDKIYYFSKLAGQTILKSMNLDGSEDCIIQQLDAEEMVLCGDFVYFIEDKEQTSISYMDLREEELSIQQLKFEPQVLEMMIDFAEESIVKRATPLDRDDSLGEYQPAFISNLWAGNGYLMFESGCKLDGMNYTAVYLYNVETGDLKLLNQQYQIPFEWRNV